MSLDIWIRPWSMLHLRTSTNSTLRVFRGDYAPQLKCVVEPEQHSINLNRLKRMEKNRSCKYCIFCQC
jgi:hypothetical protein